MNSCPHCDHNLLCHLRKQNLYWLCSHCNLETSDSFVKAQNRSTLLKTLAVARL